jgi:ubiquinone/menaquinone biosynthesis C-methylase UbiE
MEPQAYDEMHQLESTHWWYAGMRHITQTLLEPVLPKRHDLQILDAGCGTGANLEALSTFGCVYGFDYSALALKYSHQNHEGQLARASIEALPYPSNTFDLVTSFDVLVCYEVRDDVAALRELARVAKPGGHVLVRLAALPALRGPHDRVVHGARRYVAPELSNKLWGAGLTPLRVTYANALLLPLIFTSRKIGEAAVRLGQEPGSDVNESSSLVNRTLQSVLNLEAAWIGGGRGFPAGVSIFGLAQKPST